MIIKQMKLEVSSLCNNHCELCAHHGLISYAPNYQLQLNDLKYFLKVTEESNYFIENIRIHGPGEPTLWKYFNEGIELLSKSKAIGSIFVATNGFLLKNIADTSFRKISEMRVSIYENFDKHTLLRFSDRKIWAQDKKQNMNDFSQGATRKPGHYPL
jgi:molybdenum cofactor biosynthesis enzyme MoaA